MKNHILVFMAVVIILASLLAFSFFHPGLLESAECLRSSNNCAGKEVQIIHDAHVVQILSDGFLVDQLGALVRVVGDPTGLKANDSIQLRGTWQEDSTLLIQEWHVSRQRPWRVWLSFLAVICGALIFLRTFRLDPKTRLFIARD
jgi:hypothetical protein